MQVLIKTRQLDLLSDWVRSHVKQKKMTLAAFAKLVGMNSSTFSVKLHTGMTYNDVEKIAEALNVPKPDLAKATLESLMREIREVSGTEREAEFGMEQKRME